MLLIFVYNPTRRASRRATNLTFFGLNRYARDVNVKIGLSQPMLNTNGSINNIIPNWNKLETIYLWGCQNTTGNIEIAFVNPYKLAYVYITSIYYDQNGNNKHNISSNIEGNISVFSNKYDLKTIQIVRYSLINGDIKDLKNLKKLIYVYFDYSQVTGSKTDLWNNGANIIDFSV